MDFKSRPTLLGRPLSGIIAEDHAFNTSVGINTTAVLTALSLTLPGGTVAAGDEIEFYWVGDFINTSAGAVTLQTTIKLGGVTIAATDFQSLAQTAAGIRRPLVLVDRVTIASPTSHLHELNYDTGSAAATAFQGGVTATRRALVVMTTDLSADAAFVVQQQMGTAVAGTEVRSHGGALRLFRK